MSYDRISFEGKTVFLTGANGAVGRSIVALFIRLGANMALCDKNISGLDVYMESLSIKDHRRFRIAQVDVTNSIEVERAFSDTKAYFPSLDVVITNAGIAPPGKIREITDEQWRGVFAVNVDGVFYCCREGAKHLAVGGSIVILGSVAGHRGTAERSHYAASKAAVIGLAKTLAGELGPPIRVNCVSPGVVETPMSEEFVKKYSDKLFENTPLKRISTPDEIAKSIAFLASEWACGITGTALHVNNGIYVGG